MKKSTMLILSAIFMIMILSPFRVNAASNRTFVMDYNNENFQNFYKSNIENRLDDILNACRTKLKVDDIMVGYSKSPFDSSVDTFVCYDLSQTNSMSARISGVGTSYAYIIITIPSSRYVHLKASNLAADTSLGSGYGQNTLYSSLMSLLNSACIS